MSRELWRVFTKVSSQTLLAKLGKLRGFQSALKICFHKKLFET